MALLVELKLISPHYLVGQAAAVYRGDELNIALDNEVESLPELHRQLTEAFAANSWSYRLLFIDDGSRDTSARIIEGAARSNPGEVVGVFLNRNYGQHSAILICDL